MGPALAGDREALEARYLGTESGQALITTGKGVGKGHDTIPDLQGEMWGGGTHEAHQVVLGGDAVVVLHDRHGPIVHPRRAVR